jgi:hypothetical protein
MSATPWKTSWRNHGLPTNIRIGKPPSNISQKRYRFRQLGRYKNGMKSINKTRKRKKGKGKSFQQNEAAYNWTELWATLAVTTTRKAILLAGHYVSVSDAYIRYHFHNTASRVFISTPYLHSVALITTVQGRNLTKVRRVKLAPPPPPTH